MFIGEFEFCDFQSLILTYQILFLYFSQIFHFCLMYSSTFEFSKKQVSLFKGVGILLIVFHNFFHLILPAIGENEFGFDIKIVENFWTYFQYGNWAERIDLLFSIWGHYGVAIFVLLSGYGLFFSWTKLQENDTNFIETITSYFTFIFQRISKLYPTLLIALGVYFLFSFYSSHELPTGDRLTSYLTKLSFTSNLVSGELFSLNGPWWFYSLIVQLYLFLPILYFISKKTKGYGLLVVCGLAFLADYFVGPTFEKTFHINYYALPFHHIPTFAIGILFAQYAHKQINKWGIIIPSLLLFGLGNFYFTFWVFSGLAFAILIVISFKSLNEERNISKVLIFFGDISMYLFAIHAFFRGPLYKYIGESSSSYGQFVCAIIFVAVTTFLAWCMSFVEPKIRPVFTESINKLKSIFMESSTLVYDFTKQSFLFLILFIIIRLVEVVLIGSQNLGEGILVTGLLQDLVIFGKVNSITFIFIYVLVKVLPAKKILMINSLFWSILTSFSLLLTIIFAEKLSFQGAALFSYQHLIILVIIFVINFFIQKRKIAFLRNKQLQKGLILISFIFLIFGNQLVVNKDQALNLRVAKSNKIHYVISNGFISETDNKYEESKLTEYKNAFFLYTSSFEKEEPITPKTQSIIKPLGKFKTTEYSHSGSHSIKSPVYSEFSPILSPFSLGKHLHSFRITIEGYVLVKKGGDDVTEIVLNLKDSDESSLSYQSAPIKKCIQEKELIKDKWIPFKIEKVFKSTQGEDFHFSKIHVFFWNKKHTLFYYDDLTIAIDQVVKTKDLAITNIEKFSSSFEKNIPAEYSKILTTDKSKEGGKNSIYIPKEIGFAHLYKRYIIQKEDLNYDKFIYKTQFDILAPQPEENLGKIVIQIVRNGHDDNIYWYDQSLLKDNIDANTWQNISFKHELLLKELDVKEGDVIKFFLWTNKKNFYYDDLSVEINAL